jgi:hypothetical protein
VTSYLAGCFVVGLGLPPAFFLDEKLTGPNQQAVNCKTQKKFDHRKQVAARIVGERSDQLTPEEDGQLAEVSRAGRA